jgi:hypothetical protein
VGTELAEVVSSRPEARARYVYGDGAGGASEHDLPVRYLGASPVGVEDLPAVELVAGSALAA